MVPRPLHSGQVDQVAPGAPPVPVQVGHGSVTDNVTGTRPPNIATRNGTSTTVSNASVRGSSRRPRPKIEEKISPRPPISPNSIPLVSTPPGEAPPDRAPAPARGPRAIPSNA